ncbi:pentapeptide repeat-containing protein [Acaryochloris marina NIES-2412]|uniref:pentapeptide repeat-containing protein n=1 Tax=Acaryochloris marina TaxID=155978 RepID=UPI004059CC89
MANEEQVDLLKQGVEVWNKWREENPTIEIDLKNIDLISADLNGADLNDVNLNNAKLYNTKLHRAKLIGTKLSGAALVLADLSNAEVIGADLSGANLFRADLKDTNFNGADLSGANFREANMVGIELYCANLKGAYLIDTKLSSANLFLANLSGADLTGANIESTILDYAIVDGETLIVRCKINDSTYAHGVGLDSARVEESLKTKLKKNIRKKYWVERYPHYFDRRSIPKYIRFVPRYLRLLLTPKRWSSVLKVLWSCIVREFWMSSDYGSSTKQILKTFGCWSLFFSVAYLITSPAPDVAFWPTPLDNPFLDNFGTANIFEQNICSNFPGSIVCYFQLWFRSLYFSVVTMTTLGFGDIHAHPLSVPGQALVMLQVLIGYVLLGVLITRLSILFQDVG